MSTEQWRNMNRMPAAYRKKTTDTLQANLKTLIEAYRNQKDKVYRSLEEAQEEAEQSEIYQLLKDNNKTDNYTFCTAEGRNLMSNEYATKLFIHLCREFPHTIVSQIITIWYENKWQTLEEVQSKLLK